MEQYNSRLWDEMLDEFRALGGSADNICAKQGPYGRGLFPQDPSKPIHVRIPPNLLVDMKHFKLDHGAARIGPGAGIGRREQQFLESYQRDFGWGTGRHDAENLLQMLHEAPEQLRGLLHAHFHMAPWLREPTDDVLLERFLTSRAIDDKTARLIIPIVELVNHSEGTAHIDREGGIRLSGQFSGEILVAYNKCDALDMFATWGFASNEPFALSLNMGLKSSAGTMLIGREDMVDGPGKRPFFPDVSIEGDKIALSYLMLGHKKFPRLPRSIFYKIMRDAGRPEPEAAFEHIQHMNRLRFLELIEASEMAAQALAQLLRRVARYQLEAMSHSVGARSL